MSEDWKKCLDEALWLIGEYKKDFIKKNNITEPELRMVERFLDE